jgi:N-acetylglucosaminyldiphosphoundecaprenol N-acetyl-beta-D-mannosaminyltransferase
MLEHSTFKKQRLFGIDFDVVTMMNAVDWVFHSIAVGRRSATRYVVTPNVSLTMLHQDSAPFRHVIHHADLTIVDGSPLVRASRWLGKELPERVAGSDLVYNLFDAAIEEMPLRVYLLGGAPGVANRAAEVILQRWPAVQVVGTMSPDFGFEKDPRQNAAIVKEVNAAEPDVLIVGLGAPKQETWAYQHREQISAAVTLCVGGTIDFIAGEQKRCPAWVAKLGVEWVWRMATNPRRLLGRYVRDSLRLPRLFLDEISGLCPVSQGSHFSETTPRNSIASDSSDAPTSTETP